MHNLQTIRKSHRSYEDAIKRFAERGFTQLHLHGSGYSYDIRNNWDSFLNIEKIIEADNCYIETASLFDYNRPKLIEKGTWLYKDSFLIIKFESQEKFYIYHLDGFKEGIKKDEHTISIYWHTLNIGLGSWNEEKINELTKIADRSKPIVKKKILDAINDCETEIKEWRIALKKSMTGIIK